MAEMQHKRLRMGHHEDLPTDLLIKVGLLCVVVSALVTAWMMHEFQKAMQPSSSELAMVSTLMFLVIYPLCFSIMYWEFKNRRYHFADIACFGKHRIWMIPSLWPIWPGMLISWHCLRRTRRICTGEDTKTLALMEMGASVYNDPATMTGRFPDDAKWLAAKICRHHARLAQIELDEETVKERVSKIQTIPNVLQIINHNEELQVVIAARCEAHNVVYDLGLYCVTMRIDGSMLCEVLRINAKNNALYSQLALDQTLIKYFYNHSHRVEQPFFLAKIDEAVKVAAELLNDPSVTEPYLEDMGERYFVAKY